jgi:stage II sporulation protein D
MFAFLRFTAVFLLLTSFAMAQQQDLLLRVLLSEGSVGSLNIGAHERVNGAGSQTVAGGSFRLSAGSGQVLVDGQAAGNWVEFAASEGFSLAGKTYRGNLMAVSQGGRLLFINRVWLEDYLLGVVPSEVPVNFPDAVLQAQAILARTFALYRLNPEGLYDICATERCQVYKGREVETARHSSAVEATRGLIVSYDSQPITAVYSSDSGGFTASSGEVWGTDKPYLVARPDPFSISPGGTWTVSANPTVVARELAEINQSVGVVQAMRVVAYSASGRPSSLRVVGSSRTVILNAVQASRVLRGIGLRSTRVEIRGLSITGWGNGHGVGMSQWGARGLASQGWDFRQILGYYYPGTFLSSFEVVAGLQGKLYSLGFGRVLSNR